MYKYELNENRFHVVKINDIASIDMISRYNDTYFVPASTECKIGDETNTDKGIVLLGSTPSNELVLNWFKLNVNDGIIIDNAENEKYFKTFPAKNYCWVDSVVCCQYLILFASIRKSGVRGGNRHIDHESLDISNAIYFFNFRQPSLQWQRSKQV